MGNGSVIVPGSSIIDVVTTDKEGVHLSDYVSLSIESDGTININGEEFDVYKENNASFEYLSNQFVEFPITNSSSTGYCNREGVDASIVWGERYASAIITLTCKNNSNHIVTHDATVEKNVVKEATCTEAGVTNYEAT